MRTYSLATEKIFVTIALIAGGLLLFLIPPFASPDENSHFLNAYAFSDLNFFPETEMNKLGRTFPNSVIVFVDENNSRFPQNLDAKYSYGDAYISWALQSDYTETCFKEYWNADVSLAGYFASGTGMLLYRFFASIIPYLCLSNYNLLMIGRLCNLLFYVIIIYYAQNTMLIIALLPMSIFLASTLSYDTNIICISCLLFSRTAYILKEKTVQRKDVFLIGLCSFFLVSVKTAYAPLLIILLALSVEKFGTLKRYRKYALIISGVGIVPYAIFKFIYTIVLGDFQWVYSDAMKAQFNIILSSPIGFIKTIWNSFNVFCDFYFTGFIGILGQLDTNIPKIYLCLIALVLILISIYEVSSQNIISFKWKLFSFIGVLLTVYVMFAGTYVIWTATRYQIGLNYVEGVQGRYFIPLYLWIVTWIGNSTLKPSHNINHIVENTSLSIVLLSSILTVLCVFLRYWV